jgi:hypothetical protein
MKAWDVFNWQPPGWPEPHPAVIISHPGRVAHKPEVSHEVILDASDGLDWPTLCRCDLFFMATKTDLKNQRGTVSPERRRQIIATIIRSNGWV